MWISTLPENCASLAIGREKTVSTWTLPRLAVTMQRNVGRNSFMYGLVISHWLPSLCRSCSKPKMRSTSLTLVAVQELGLLDAVDAHARRIVPTSPGGAVFTSTVGTGAFLASSAAMGGVRLTCV